MKNYITIDKEIVSGTPVFKGTRVPVQNLFDYIASGVTLDEFVSTHFPSVSKDQARKILAIAAKMLTSKNLAKAYEIATRRKPVRRTQRISAGS